MSEILIKLGNIKVEANMNDIIDVSETADGVVFSFKGGLQVVYTDPYMQSATKQVIKNSADNIRSKKLIFELDNSKVPVRIDAT